MKEKFYIGIMFINFFYWIGVPVEWAPLPVYIIAVPVSFLLVRKALVLKKQLSQE
jgi:hypothetical protein